MQFLDAVNRVLRINGIIRGDDDALTSFSDTQHSSTSALAQISIQDEIVSLISEEILGYQHAESTITLISGTRLYSLAADFIRFRDPVEKLFMSELNVDGTVNGTPIPYVDEDALRRSIPYYRDATGGGAWSFYIPGGSTNQVGFYALPGASDNGRIFRYYYEKDVQVSLATDVLPFKNNNEAYAFCRLAGLHFNILFQQSGKPNANDPVVFDQDPVLVSMRAQLAAMMNQTATARFY